MLTQAPVVHPSDWLEPFHVFVDASDIAIGNALMQLTKLHSALWAYRTSYKTSMQSSPFRLVFRLEVVMPIQFHIPSLCTQVCERLSESLSEQIRLQQLLELGETRVHSMAILEHEQQRQKAFVDRHHGTNEKHFKIGKAVLVFQTRMGQMSRKLRFRWTGPYWIIGAKNRTFEVGTLASKVLHQKINGFRLKPYLEPTPPIGFAPIKIIRSFVHSTTSKRDPLVNM